MGASPVVRSVNAVNARCAFNSWIHGPGMDRAVGAQRSLGGLAGRCPAAWARKTRRIGEAQNPGPPRRPPAEEGEGRREEERPFVS
ncbi:MAG: hypothetical protein ACO3OK_03680, partial [Limisphaerales bacterium]